MPLCWGSLVARSTRPAGVLPCGVGLSEGDGPCGRRPGRLTAMSRRAQPCALHRQPPGPFCHGHRSHAVRAPPPSHDTRCASGSREGDGRIIGAGQRAWMKKTEKSEWRVANSEEGQRKSAGWEERHRDLAGNFIHLLEEGAPAARSATFSHGGDGRATEHHKNGFRLFSRENPSKGTA